MLKTGAYWLVLGALGLHGLAPARAQAALPRDLSNRNVALCTAGGDQSVSDIVSDGTGAIIAWSDMRGANSDIYVQRVSADGAPQWTANGVAVCTAVGDQFSPVVVSDGAQGAIVVWQDRRGANYDVYAQRINAAGVPQWTANGVALCTAAGDQLPYRPVSDGAGGAIVTWTDYRNGATGDIYARRVNATGAPQWTADGVALCVFSGDQFAPRIASDGSGGAIVAWHDHRATSWDIYAQRVSAAGAAQWTANGVALCTATGDQQYPFTVSDGAGGAIVIWDDTRNGSNTNDIYAQRVNAAGTPQWTANGVSLCTAASYQIYPRAISDGGGGAIVVWRDNRGTDQDVYVQRVNAAGTAQWAADGVALCVMVNDQDYPEIVSDGASGAIVAWADRRSGTNWDLYAQRVSSAGAPILLANGVALCTAVNDQPYPEIASDGTGNAIAAWRDRRSGTNDDIYAQVVERFYFVGAEPTIAGVHDVPNDQGGKIKVSWYSSYLDQTSDPSLTAYDVYRSAPGSVAATALSAGARALASFAEIPTPGTRAFVFEPSAAQVYAWEYLGTVNPVHFLDAYGYIAPTTGDSIAGSNPLSIFMVVGRNSNGSTYWLSAPDSGYSVDNIAPAAPAAFAAQYINPAPQPVMETMSGPGFTWLHWARNGEPDFVEYRLHRGASAGFTPGPGNLLTAQPDTGYQDVGPAGGYYKLLALDRHGNASQAAMLMPPDILGTGTGVAPANVWLAPVSPNPVMGPMELHYALPRGTRVTLAIYDVAGRQVAELVSGFVPAGEHRATWDGRDGAGHLVMGGVYACRLEAEGRTLSRRIAVVR